MNKVITACPSCTRETALITDEGDGLFMLRCGHCGLFVLHYADSFDDAVEWFIELDAQSDVFMVGEFKKIAKN